QLLPVHSLASELLLPSGSFSGPKISILDPLENESGEHRWTHEATTPFGIVSGCGLRGEDFIQGFTLLFETRNLVADSNQQVAIETELRLVGNGTMPWDDHHLLRDFRQSSLGSKDHPIDTAAS